MLKFLEFSIFSMTYKNCFFIKKICNSHTASSLHILFALLCFSIMRLTLNTNEEFLCRSNFVQAHSLPRCHSIFVVTCSLNEYHWLLLHNYLSSICVSRRSVPLYPLRRSHKYQTNATDDISLKFPFVSLSVRIESGSKNYILLTQKPTLRLPSSLIYSILLWPITFFVSHSFIINMRLWSPITIMYLLLWILSVCVASTSVL